MEYLIAVITSRGLAIALLAIVLVGITVSAYRLAKADRRAVPLAVVVVVAATVAIGFSLFVLFSG